MQNACCFVIFSTPIIPSSVLCRWHVVAWSVCWQYMHPTNGRVYGSLVTNINIHVVRDVRYMADGTVNTVAHAATPCCCSKHLLFSLSIQQRRRRHCCLSFSLSTASCQEGVAGEFPSLPSNFILSNNFLSNYPPLTSLRHFGAMHTCLDRLVDWNYKIWTRNPSFWNG